jgi:hypothetical protein
MAYLVLFIDGFAYFSVFPYIIYDYLKCVSRFGATLYYLVSLCCEVYHNLTLLVQRSVKLDSTFRFTTTNVELTSTL